MTDVRTCERDGCTNPIRRRPRDSEAQYIRRRFCALACYRAHVEVERPTRECETCGDIFGPSRHERPAQFVKRDPRFCSRVCCGAAKSAGFGERAIPRCAVCQVEIRPRPGDTPGRAARRRRCLVHAGVRLPSGRALRTRASSSRTAPPRPKPTLTVFGDVAPAQPWRPASWGPTSGATS